jgi:hypothetical protein
MTMMPVTRGVRLPRVTGMDGLPKITGPSSTTLTMFVQMVKAGVDGPTVADRHILWFWTCGSNFCAARLAA